VNRREEREEAFEALVENAWPGLVRLGTALVGDRHAAEDLAQTALLKTYEHWRRIREPAAAGAYARTALVRDAVRLRTRRRREERRDHESLPELASRDVAPGAALSVALERALTALPTPQRAALVLRHLLDLSEADTATALGCSVGTVKSRCSRAAASLRAAGLLDDDPREPQHTGGTA